MFGNAFFFSAGSQLLLDTLATPASFALSLQKLRANYTGFCLRVRRSSDNSLLDVGFVENELDTESLLNFSSNLLRYSEDLTSAVWGKLRLTVSANQASNPLNGLVDSDKLIPANDTANNGVNCTISNAIIGQNYTCSIYVKSAGYDFVQLTPAIGMDTSKFVNFNLATGVVGNTNMLPSDYSITAIGSGWYRVSFTGVATATATGLFIFVSSIDLATRGGSSTTNGVDGIFAWGGQLDLGNIPKLYEKTEATAGGNIFVTTAFDQSVNARHVTQANANLQPSIVTNGVLNTINGKPAIDWGNSVNDRGLSLNLSSVMNPQKIFIVADYNGPSPFAGYAGLLSFSYTSFRDLVITGSGGNNWFSNSYILNNAPVSSVALPTILSPFILENVTIPDPNKNIIYVGSDRGIIFRGWVGRISEIIIFDDVVSGTDKDKIYTSESERFSIPI